MSRQAIVIPNIEKLPNAEPLTKDLEYGESHALGVIEFSRIYNLGITYESIGLPFLTYCSEKWYQEIAKLGHIFLRLENESNIIYLPLDISLNQYEWFKNEKDDLKDKLVNISVQVIDSDGTIQLSESSSNTPASDAYLFKLVYEFLEDQAVRSKKNKSRTWKRDK